MGLRVKPQKELSIHFFSETLLQSPGPGTPRTTTIPRLSPSAVRSVVSSALSCAVRDICEQVFISSSRISVWVEPLHTWVLRVDSVTVKDAGRYECHLNQDTDGLPLTLPVLLAVHGD